MPYLRGLAMVAANYGLATRNLGTVSLIGPMRMDYADGDPLGARRRPRAVGVGGRHLRGVTASAA